MGKRGPQRREIPGLPPEYRRRLAHREGYVDALVWEFDRQCSDTGRAALLRLIGAVYRHLDPALPDSAPPVPRDPRRYLEWLRSRVRRAMAAHPQKTAQLVDRDRDLTAALEAMAPTTPPTPAPLLEELRADLPHWSDDEILAVHAEGLRRSIPGFEAR